MLSRAPRSVTDAPEDSRCSCLSVLNGGRWVSPLGGVARVPEFGDRVSVSGMEEPPCEALWVRTKELTKGLHAMALDKSALELTEALSSADGGC